MPSILRNQAYSWSHTENQIPKDILSANLIHQHVTVGKVIYADKEYDVLEAVVTGIHDRPKKLPSEVDMGVKTGLLLCQDINFMNHDPQNSPASKSFKN